MTPRGVPHRAARLRLARARAAGAAARRCRCRRRAWPRPSRWRRSARPTTTSARCTATAAPTATSFARSAAGSTTRPTSSRTRAPRPRSQAVLEWALAAGAAVIPFGGGTSVVGGVEPRVGDGLRRRGDDRPEGARSACSRSTPSRWRRGSRRARPARGSRQQLGEHGLTLRHFPQSFQFSTLGGWIATRAGGHFATLYTHIDDLVESVRALTPAGVWESRRLPGLGRRRLARPDADRLGGHARRDHRGLGPGAAAARRHRASAAVRFAGLRAPARDAVRALSQSGLYPTNCRLIDAAEAEVTGAGDGSHALLVLGFESADHDVERWMTLALDMLRRPRRDVGAPRPGGERVERRGRQLARGVPARPVPARHVRRDRRAVGDVRDRDHVGPVPGVPRAVMERACRAPSARCAAAGIGHVPLHARLSRRARPRTTRSSRPARRGAELEQWAEIKRAASDAVIAGGGTITHHHAVGRDHRPWYDRQRPEPFAAALRGAKAAVDPTGALNPGVLIDP